MMSGQPVSPHRPGLLRGAAAAQLCAAALVIWQSTASMRALQRADSAGVLLRQVEALQSDVLRARVEHRSAIIEDDASSLARYRDADRALQSDLDQLSRLAMADPARQQMIAALQDRLDDDRARSEQTLGQPDMSIETARALLRSAEAREARDATTALVEAIARSAQADLAARSLGRKHALLWLFASIMCVLCATAALGGLAIRRLRRYAAELSASEARYRALSEDSPDAVFVVAEMRVVYANLAALELWRADAEHRVIGRDVLELWHPDDRELVSARLRSVVARGSTTSPRVLRVLHSDGTTCEVEARETLIRYAEQPAIHVVARDVTQRRASELALALSEQRFRAVMDAMAEGVVLQNEVGEIKLCNRAAERILGLSTDQIRGLTSADSRWLALDESGAELPGDRHYAMVALRTGQPCAGNMSVQRPDGSRAWLRVSAIPLFRPGEERPYAVTTTFADITKERAATQRLQESMAQYRLLAENSADMVSRRTLDHRFEYVSPSHTAILGWSQDELLAMRALDLIHPDDLPAIVNGPMQSVGRGERSAATTLRVRHKHGHYVWVEALSTPIVDSTGKAVAYTVCARDVSARRLLEQELRQAQKLEAMGRMAGAMAHDFNNVLTVIRGATELLSDVTGGAQSPAVIEYVAEIGRAVDRAARLTAQLLSFSHGQHTVPRLLSVDDLLRESQDFLRRLLPEHCSLELQSNLPAEPVHVWGDKGELLQILANLVMNAADAMPKGGSIVVEFAVEQLLQPLTHRFGSLPRGAYVALSVTDGGMGIQPATLDRIFEPFFTTKPRARVRGSGSRQSGESCSKRTAR